MGNAGREHGHDIAAGDAAVAAPAVMMPPGQMPLYARNQRSLPCNATASMVLPPPGTPPADLRPVLARAFASAQYLAARGDNLALLDRHGPPAWLLANYHLESEVRALEAELADTRRRIDQVNHERATRQAGVKPELDGLEEAWRKGLGRVLETEVAVDEVKAQIRQELRRRNAGPA
ncbi:hypothetical protein UVI_02041390 [Ustilaginoidea virens]|uniref:BCAS2 family protein n=1 Tax=Ustilaginoidea virens TaxID=1159556 RepID=A0A1B5KWA8_USTVR|nr:hypothetical protein UVI_02041390 [Ustilaginoidea virens]